MKFMSERTADAITSLDVAVWKHAGADQACMRHRIDLTEFVRGSFADRFIEM